jgi:hypothetical protein
MLPDSLTRKDQGQQSWTTTTTQQQQRPSVPHEADAAAPIEEGDNLTQFSIFLKEEARMQVAFIQMLEQVLENIVTYMRLLDHKKIHHVFSPMNITQHQVIYELADAYGCKTFI